MMLQQTQVATVIPYYNRWLGRFPDFRSLAAASESDVLHAWQGLGYYARARNLHAVAKAVTHRKFPTAVEEMRRLPGLGRYTANAVATFAFDQSVPVVEANIARLLARLTNLQLPIDSAAGREMVWNSAAALVPKQNAARFNSALMDLGATVCTARQPKCEICPVRNCCTSDDPMTLPRKRARPAVRKLVERHAFTQESGRILLEQSKTRWRGMWILPRLPNECKPTAALHRSEFPFTHHRITLSVHRHANKNVNTNARWFPISSLASIPMPSPHRRALTHLLACRRSAT
ncbi:MAG: A/G-specific adenine glycosylase [Chthoniobacterales bacterium]